MACLARLIFSRDYSNILRGAPLNVSSEKIKSICYSDYIAGLFRNDNLLHLRYSFKIAKISLRKHQTIE